MDPRLKTSARLCGVNWEPVSNSRNAMGCLITATQLIPYLRPRELCPQRCWECEIEMMTMSRCRICGLSAGRDTVRHTQFCCKKRGKHRHHMCMDHLKEHFPWSSGSSGSSEYSNATVIRNDIDIELSDATADSNSTIDPLWNSGSSISSEDSNATVVHNDNDIDSSNATADSNNMQPLEVSRMATH